MTEKQKEFLTLIYNTLRQAYCVPSNVWYMRELKKIIEGENNVRITDGDNT